MSAPEAFPLFVAERGQGRPLILLHGWASHGGYFGPQMETLGERFHLLCPDLPGHRNSIASLPRLGIPHLADSLHRLISERSLSGAVVIGWSMGAMVAFDYIARYGQAALSGLVIEDMTARIINDESWHLGIRNDFLAEHSAMALQAMRGDWASYVRNSLPKLFARSRSSQDPLYRWAEAEMLANDGAAMAALWASMAEQDFRSLLPQLTLPVLLLHGGDSQLYDPAVHHWMETVIPNARRLCLEQAGHSPHLEMPDAYNAAVSAFAAAF